MELKGKLLNEKEVELGHDELRVAIRPIYCMECGHRIPPLGFNVADIGFIPEEQLNAVLSVTVCRECVKELAEEPEGGWWINHLLLAKEQIENIFNDILKRHGVETIEEFNEEIGSTAPTEQMVANELVRVLETLDKCTVTDF